jgi:hypothetical protein
MERAGGRARAAPPSVRAAAVRVVERRPAVQRRAEWATPAAVVLVVIAAAAVE